MPPELFWGLIPITALMIPIVIVLTKHQQKMAEIFHKGGGGQNDIAALRQEIAELKILVHQQAITLDNFAATQRALNVPPPNPNLTDRLSQG